MDLDELKKSWDTIDDHLKNKQLVNDESISKLINYASNNINTMSRFNYRLRLISLCILIGSLFVFAIFHIIPNIFYIIIYLAAVPALTWDIYCSRYLSKTKIDELPITTVINRFNRMHRLMIYERFIGIIFVMFLTIVFFIVKQIWSENALLISFFVIDWTICLLVALWVYRKNFSNLREIKKNLSELKELKEKEL